MKKYLKASIVWLMFILLRCSTTSEQAPVDSQNATIDNAYERHMAEIAARRQAELEREQTLLPDERFNGHFRYRINTFTDTHEWWFINGTIKAYSSHISWTGYGEDTYLYEVSLDEGRLWYRSWNQSTFSSKTWYDAGEYYFDEQGNLHLVVEYQGNKIDKLYRRYTPDVQRTRRD